jgi:hypothetical protein
VRVSATVQQVFADLEALLAFAARHEAPADVERLREAVAGVLGATLEQLARPLYAEHPELTPPSLAGYLTPAEEREEIQTDENEVAG